MGHLVTNPIPFFADLDGNPLDEGYVYVGQENTNPITTPVTVCQDSALQIAMKQPLRTVSGMVAVNGTPQRLFTGAAKCSLLVMDKRGRIVFSVPSVSFAVSFSDLTDVPSLQPALGFTPVQQGGGTGQNNDKVEIGSDGNGHLKATVAGTDLGQFVFETELQTDIAAINSKLGAVPANKNLQGEIDAINTTLAPIPTEITNLQTAVTALQQAEANEGGATSFTFGGVGTYVMAVQQTWGGQYWVPGGLQGLTLGQQVSNIWAISSFGHDGYAGQLGNGSSQQMAGTWTFLGGIEMDMGSVDSGSAAAGLFVRVA